MKIIAFEKDGVRYERCKECPITAERFESTHSFPSYDNGHPVRHIFNGIQWALDNGFTAIQEE